MTLHAPLSMSKEAYFAWIERQDGRYEYAKGRVIMMVRVTLNHALVTSNLHVSLKSRLPAERFNVLFEGFAVNVGDSVRYPDVLVQPAQRDGKALEAKAPILIAEVLSPSTLHVDFGDKRQEYLQLPSLDTYLVIAPDEPRTWIWQRGDEGFPGEPQIIEGLNERIALTALGVEVPLSEIYRGIP
jgi:Uma2 family endonuclease